MTLNDSKQPIRLYNEHITGAIKKTQNNTGAQTK